MRNLKLYVLTAILFLQSAIAGAISEANYLTSFKSNVLPYICQNLKRGSFNSFDGTRIVYATLIAPQSRATIVISQGRTESIIGLSEVIYDLAHMGYSVAVVDHRGQGESQRLVPNSTVGHVGSFYDYVDDFKIFVYQIVKPQMPGPYLLMGSSMGGAIASLYMIEDPFTFTAAALGAPMIHIDMSPFPLSLVDIVASGFEIFENSTNFAPTRGPYDFNQKFAGNQFTHSQNRFYIDVALTRHSPQIATGGPSLGWVREALKAGNQLMLQSNRMRTPTVIYQAGLDDVVENASQITFCHEAANCRLRTFPGAFHWIFMEADPIRNRLFIDLDYFFETQLHPQAPPKQTARANERRPLSPLLRHIEQNKFRTFIPLKL